MELADQQAIGHHGREAEQHRPGGNDDTRKTSCMLWAYSAIGNFLS
jgi:hypothetical protein